MSPSRAESISFLLRLPPITNIDMSASIANAEEKRVRICR